jgi:hypothetical protein
MVFGGTTAVLQKVSGALPLFVMVTRLAGELVLPGASEPKLMLPGRSDTRGAVPVPFRVAVCVPPPLLALSVTVSVCVWRPSAVAEYVMLMAQLEFAASVVPQVLVPLKPCGLYSPGWPG